MGGSSEETVQLKQEHAALRRLVNDLRNKLDEAEGRARKAEASRGAGGGGEARLRGEVLSLQGQLERQRGDMAVRVGAHSKLVGDLEGQLEAARARLGEEQRQAREREGMLERERAERQADREEARRHVSERQRKVDLLKQYCSVNQKERAALRTIMEVKIKGLVDSAIESVEGEEAARGGVSGVLRDRLSALRKIVNASVQAMKADEVSGAGGDDAGGK